jgi:high-affinity nickel-transport protein
MASFDINKAGFAIAALFVVVWVAAIAVWKLGGIDRRWRPATAPSPTLEPGNEN